MICLISKPKRAAIVIGCIWITAGMFALPALWLSSSSPLDAPEFDCKADDIVFDLSGCVPIWEVDTDFIINLFKVGLFKVICTEKSELYKRAEA